MGKLLQATIEKLQELEVSRQEAAPDYTQDPHAAMDYIKRRNTVNYLQAETGRALINALRKLPKAQQDAFYERCIQPDRRQSFSKQDYERYLDPNTNDGQKSTQWLIRDQKFGQNWHTTILTLEEMMGEEAADELAYEIETMAAPSAPGYPEEEKLDYPLEETIGQIKDSLDIMDINYTMDRDLLDAVNEDLAIVKDSVREHFNAVDNDVPGVKAVQSTMNMYSYDMQNKFIGEELEGGAYKDKFPSMVSNQATNRRMYTMNDAIVSADGPLKQEDVEKLKQLKPNIQEPLKKDILSLTNKMEAFGVDKYKVPSKTTMNLEGGASPEQIFMSEQGYKLYAYWPLYHARQDLVSAVQERDLVKIRKAHETYQSVKKELDGMLAIVQKHPTGICPGNINSTRPLDGPDNPLPLNHMEDFVGHSQLNGIFCLYALSKNTKSTPEQLLEDPVGVMNKASAEHIEKHGLGSRKTAGSKLVWAFGDPSQFQGEWTYQTAMLCTRAFEGVASLSEDPKERSRINGTGQIAVAVSTTGVNAHCQKWQKLVAASKEQKKLMYQHALLLPEEEFKPLDYADAFDRPDWKEKLSTGALIDKMKREGKLDYTKLTDRLSEIEADAKNAERTMTGGYKRDSLLFAAHDMFREIIKKASPQEKETEAFKAFEKKTAEMLVASDSVKSSLKKLNTKMTVLQGEKKGLFLSSENSEEHKKMIRSQNTFKFKLMQMQGKELPAALAEEDKEYLKTITLKQAYDVARDATFDYCSKKTDKGRSSRFVHQTGRVRHEAAEDSLTELDKMADLLELRSPAQKLIDEARQEVLEDRRDDDWTPEKTERAAAKIMYAMTLEHQGISPEEQKKRLAPERLEMGIAYIRGQDAFKKMMQKEGAGTVADAIAEGHGKLTDAYVRGMNSAAREQNREAGKDPKQMSSEEKGEVWKNQTLQM